MLIAVTCAMPLAPVMVFCPKSPETAGVADRVHSLGLAVPESTTLTRVRRPGAMTYSLCQTHLMAISSWCSASWVSSRRTVYCCGLTESGCSGEP